MSAPQMTPLDRLDEPVVVIAETWEEALHWGLAEGYRRSRIVGLRFDDPQGARMRLFGIPQGVRTVVLGGQHRLDADMRAVLGLVGAAVEDD